MATAAAPVYGASGLITSYSNSPRRNAQKPIYGPSGLIESYSGGDANVPTGTTYNNPSDPTGKYNFNAATGLNQQGLTKGQQAVQDYQASTGLVSTTKSAPLAKAASDTLANETALQTGVVKSFQDYLTEAKQLQEQGAAAVKQDTETLNTAPSKLESSLSKTVQDFANQTGALDTKVTDLNAANAATVNANIAQSKQNITDYQTAAEAVANQAIAASNARSNAYQSATGTPTSDSGYAHELAAATTSNIMLPVEQQVAALRQSNLTNYITPQQQNLYANNIAQVTGLEMPVAQALVNIGITNANQLAQFTASLTGKSLQEQMTYLTSLGIPLQMAQQLAQSLPSSLGQLSAIDQANTYYGLAQDYQNPVAGGLPVYNPGPPNYPPRGNTPYPNTGPVSSNPNGYLPTDVTPGAGQPVGINAQGQLVDAQGRVVNYAPPATVPSNVGQNALPPASWDYTQEAIPQYSTVDQSGYP